MAQVDDDGDADDGDHNDDVDDDGTEDGVDDDDNEGKNLKRQENARIALYYISLCLGWEIDDQLRNPNINNKDHIVGN